MAPVRRREMYRERQNVVRFPRRSLQSEAGQSWKDLMVRTARTCKSVEWERKEVRTQRP